MNKFEKRKMIIDLYDNKGKTFEEIAEILNKEEGGNNSKQSVHGLYHRHKRKMEDEKDLKKRIFANKSVDSKEEISDREKVILGAYSITHSADKVLEVLEKYKLNTGSIDTVEGITIEEIKDTLSIRSGNVAEYIKQRVEMTAKLIEAMGTREMIKRALSWNGIAPEDNIIDLYIMQASSSLINEVIKKVETDVLKLVSNKEYAKGELEAIVQFLRYNRNDE